MEEKNQSFRKYLCWLITNYPGDKGLFFDNITLEEYCASKMNTNVSEFDAYKSSATEVEVALLAKHLGVNIVFIRREVLSCEMD